MRRKFVPAAERVYRIRRTAKGVRVTVDGRPLSKRLDLASHSPTGFEFGYGGSGPAQLALAVLADCCGDDLAVKYHQSFKWDVIASLPAEGGTLTGAFVREELARMRAKRLARQGRQPV